MILFREISSFYQFRTVSTSHDKNDEIIKMTTFGSFDILLRRISMIVRSHYFIQQLARLHNVHNDLNYLYTYRVLIQKISITNM